MVDETVALSSGKSSTSQLVAKSIAHDPNTLDMHCIYEAIIFGESFDSSAESNEGSTFRVSDNSLK